MEICGVNLSEKEIELLKQCCYKQYCSECNMFHDCIVDSLYLRVDTTKYCMLDFFKSLDEVIENV